MAKKRDAEAKAAKGKTAHNWLALTILVGGLAVVSLDSTILGVAVPSIVHDLHMDLADAEWLNSLYPAVVGSLLLATGTLADRFGRHRMFMIGLIIFASASLLAGLSPSIGPLIGTRALQALGAASIMPSTLSTVNTLFRGAIRAIAFGIWGAVIAGAAALGPIVGGALTQWLSWRWIFFINVPLAIILATAAKFGVPETSKQVLRQRKTDLKRFDFLGLVLSNIGFASLIFAIIEGPNIGWWKPSAPLHLFGTTWSTSYAISVVPLVGGVAVISLGVFFWWEVRRNRRTKHVVLDLSLFRIPTFTWGSLTVAMVSIGEFSLLFVLPLYLIHVLDHTTVEAGAMLASMATGAFISGLIAHRFAVKLGSPRTVILGLSLEVAAVIALVVMVGPHASGWSFTVPLGIYGLGVGLASAQLTGIILSGVPVGKSGQASGTQSTVRQVGSAMGTAFSGTALAVVLAMRLPKTLEKMGLDREDASHLAAQTRMSVGSNLDALRAQTSSQAHQLVETLAAGLSQGVRGAMITSTVFLLIGLGGSLIVSRVARGQTPLGRIRIGSPRLPTLRREQK